MGGASWTKLVGQNVAPANRYRWLSQNRAFLTPSKPFKCYGVMNYSYSGAKSHRKLAKPSVATDKVGGAELKVGGAAAPTNCIGNSDPV